MLAIAVVIWMMGPSTLLAASGAVDRPDLERRRQGGAPAPLLVHDGTGWTLNGKRFADGDLSTVVRAAYETRADKHLLVQVPGSFTHQRLIDALAERIDDGVERFSLVPPDGDRMAAVAVRLETVPGLEEDLSLAAADERQEPGVSPDLVIRLPAAGTADPAPGVAMSSASGSRVVRLRVDATRTVEDLWAVLRAVSASGGASFLFAVERRDGPGAAARDCRKGVAEACGRLGMAYFAGSDGLPKDHRAALPVLRQGCAGHDVVSCEVLGTIYSVDDGVVRDVDESMRHHTAACRLGSDYSCEVLRRAKRPVPARKPPPQPGRPAQVLSAVD